MPPDYLKKSLIRGCTTSPARPRSNTPRRCRRAPVTACGSNARTCNRCFRSGAAARTTRWPGWRRRELKKGVVAASAGNHAQGVALAASKLGTKAVIVMPRTTPQIKIDAVRNLGGKVVLHGDNYDAAYVHAREIATKRKLTFVHPYDDPDVIAGQGTVGLEILKQHTDALYAIFVPVGGGGLISGIAAYVKQLRPEVKIIGVEPEDADAMDRSLKAGKRVTLDHVGIFADGVAVRQVGEETFRLCRQYVDEMVIVSNDEICAAIKDIFEDRRSILEPAGALAYAGLKNYVGEEAPKEQAPRRHRLGRERQFRPPALRRRARRSRRAPRGDPRRHHPRASGRLEESSAPSSATTTSPSSTTASPTRRRRTSSSACKSARPRR